MANLLLSLAAAGAALGFVRSLTSRPLNVVQQPPEVASLPAATTEWQKPKPANYRRQLTGKALFVTPTQPPPGRDMDEAIAKAKAKLQLRGIASIRGKLGAYFEVLETARPPAMPGIRSTAARRAGRNVARNSEFGVYYEGDRVGDFTVKRIEPGSVVLTLAGQEVLFSL